jgi:hypothetical protein
VISPLVGEKHAGEPCYLRPESAVFTEDPQVLVEKGAPLAVPTIKAYKGFIFLILEGVAG